MTKTKHVNEKKGKNVSKTRGTVLSVLLVLIFLHALLATAVVYSTLKEQYAAETSWVLPVMGLVSLASIVAAVGMWYWKKWAITLYAVTSVIAMVIHLMLTGSLLVVFYDLLPVVILVYVIDLQSKRKLFE
jgi:hypothetical protein